MTVLSTVGEIEVAVLSAAEEADVLHDRRLCGGQVNSITIITSLFNYWSQTLTIVVGKEEL